jgi:hypothetical protein
MDRYGPNNGITMFYLVKRLCVTAAATPHLGEKVTPLIGIRIDGASIVMINNNNDQ